MNNFCTIVIRMPDSESEKNTVQTALNMLAPHQTAMSLEDEITVLEHIENHEDFEEYIAEDARERAAKCGNGK